MQHQFAPRIAPSTRSECGCLAVFSPQGRVHVGVVTTWLKNSTPEQDSLTDLSYLSIGPSGPSSTVAGDQVGNIQCTSTSIPSAASSGSSGDECRNHSIINTAATSLRTLNVLLHLQDLAGFDEHPTVKATPQRKVAFSHSLSMPVPKRPSRSFSIPAGGPPATGRDLRSTKSSMTLLREDNTVLGTPALERALRPDVQVCQASLPVMSCSRPCDALVRSR